MLAAVLVLAFPASSGSGDRPARVPAEPDGMLVLAVLSPERAMVADPRTGAATARALPGGTLCYGPLLAAGDRVVFFGLRGRRVVPRALPLRGDGPAVALGPADTIAESPTPGRLWLSRWTPLRGRVGRLSLREIDAHGRVVDRARWLLPRWATQNAILGDGSLLISRGRGLVLRRPDGSRRLFRGGWPLAAGGDRFAWHRYGSRRLRLWIDDEERSFDPPGRWRPDVGGGGAFSPDGTRLALPVRTRSGSRVAVLDLERGAWRLVPGGRVGDYKAIAWSPSGRWLYFSRGKNVLAARDGVGSARRLPIRTRGTVMSIASTRGSAAR